jgi:hypothetical protein
MSEVVVSAHQPNFLPYLGFFEKMRDSDVFVIRDEVLYVPKEYHNRNRIRINSNDNLNNPQSKWLNVPVVEQDDFIKYIMIKRDTIQNKRPWNEQILHDLKVNYEKAPFFDKYYPEFEEIFKNPDDRLMDVNMRIIRLFMKAFNINTKIIYASDLGLKSAHYEKTDGSIDLLNISMALGTTTYLSGAGGRNYLNQEPFEKAGIKVVFQDYHHPVYRQCFPGFLPYMGAVDALFCTGTLPEQ